MAQTYKICLLPGDGIGPEIIAEGVKVLDAIAVKHGVSFEYTEALIGGRAIDETGSALPEATLAIASGSGVACGSRRSEVGYYRSQQTTP